MKTDFYTKTMLTLIVLFLGILSFERVYDSFIREAEAANSQWDCFKTRGTWIGLTDHLTEKGWTEMEMLGDWKGEMFFCGRK